MNSKSQTKRWMWRKKRNTKANFLLNLCWSNARSFISYANNDNNNGLDDDNPIVNHPTVAIYLGFQLQWTHWIFFLFILQDITIIYWHSQLVLVLFHHNIVDLVVGQVSVLFFSEIGPKRLQANLGLSTMTTTKSGQIAATCW